MSYDVTAILKANVSNFTNGLKEAQSAFEGFKNKSNGAFENISSGLKNAGVALTAGFTAPALAGIGAVVKGYASLEQNLGGTEAVFGNFAKTVQTDAKDAYRQMGLSASDYMATANKMGSLFQGSGIKQEQALDMTSKAMKRAADVASVMGVDMKMAMESVAGAAKGNFTMMDNLGVAMNATTLEAYALEKGMNFKWETASNAQKAELAMKMFMDRTKQYDGNFLKESEKTVAGSLDAMKGAFSNFVSGLGDPEADIKDLLERLGATIKNFASNIKRVVGNIWDNLPLAPWQKWVLGIAVGAGPVLLAISGVMKGIGTLKSVFSGVGAVLSNPWGLAIVGLVALVAGLVHAYNNSETFRNIVNSAVGAVVDTFNKLKTAVQPVTNVIKSFFSSINIGAFAPAIAGLATFTLGLMKLKGIKITNPFKLLKFTFPKIPNPFTGLVAMVKSVGTSIKTAFSGIGTGIATALKGAGTAVATVLRGIASAISMLNPAGVAAFAMGLAAIVVALTALSAVQGMILPFLQGLADIFVSLANGVLQAFSSALVTVAPVMTTIASAIAMLSPVIVAFGTAFATVATAIGGAVATIVTALTPIVSIITSSFVQIVSIISNAIVQIVQAIAPFAPEITKMVQAVAPVVSEIVQAFTNLVNQISPIIDSVTKLFGELGKQISSVLQEASGVIDSFGSAIRSVLDGIAGIFDSIGQAAKNAGEGFKSMAEGLQIITSLNIFSLGASLAVVATGLVGIVASGIGSAGAGLQAAGMGLQLIAQSAQMASTVIGSLPPSLIALTSSLGALPAQLTVVASAMTAFATGVQQSVTGLASASSSISLFGTALTMLVSATATVGSSVGSMSSQMSSAGSAVGQLGSSVSNVSSQINSFGSSVSSAMSNVVSIINSAGSQIVNAMQQIGSNVTASIQPSMNQMQQAIANSMTSSAQVIVNGGSQMISAIRNAGTQMVTMMQATMNQMKSTVQNGFTSIANEVRNASSRIVQDWRTAGNELVSVTQNTVNNVNSSLRNVGAGVSLYSNGHALMAGLKSGIDAGWASITASVSSMAAWIKKNKGPVSYDKRLLVENGQALMSGLYRGISSGWTKVQRLVVPMANDISNYLNSGLVDTLNVPNASAVLGGALSVSHSPQSVIHHIDNVQNQQKLLDKLDDLIDEARKGRVVYLDGREVGRSVDRHIGQNAQIRSRTSWA